jgi:DNA helicase-2/ATP-dependent DNA helicase PcrA
VFPSRYRNAPARLADLDRLAGSARAATSRSRLLAELTLDPPERTGDLAGPPHLDDDYLVLSTIHSAKGGEWRVVHLIHAADGNIPSEMALGDKEGLAEERRLAYVAVTRARDELHVTFPLRFHVHRHGLDDRHHLAQLSRFLEPHRALLDERSSPVAACDETDLELATVTVADEVDALLHGLWAAPNDGRPS